MKLASCKSALNPPVVYSTYRSKGGGPGVSCFVVYFTRRFVVYLSMCHFVLVFFSPCNIAITSLGEDRANLSAFRMLVRFALVWFRLFSLPLDVWEGLRLVIVPLPGLFSYLFCCIFLDKRLWRDFSDAQNRIIRIEAYSDSEGLDEPVHRRSLISTYAVCLWSH